MTVSKKGFSVRLNTELKKWVNKTAKENMRSMNAEINVLLQGLKDKREKPKG